MVLYERSQRCCSETSLRKTARLLRRRDCTKGRSCSCSSELSLISRTEAAMTVGSLQRTFEHSAPRHRHQFFLQAPGRPCSPGERSDTRGWRSRTPYRPCGPEFLVLKVLTYISMNRYSSIPQMRRIECRSTS